jgi:hypothetical protein
MSERRTRANNVIPLPFFVADALTGLVLQASGGPNGRWRRIGLTSGSADHISAQQDGSTRVMVRLVAIGSEETHIDLSVSPPLPQHELDLLLATIIEHILEAPMMLHEMQTVRSVPMPGASKKPQPGAPTDPDNDWARMEVHKGTDRDIVYQEWAQRKRRDPDDAKTRDAFRKALNRKSDGRK